MTRTTATMCAAIGLLGASMPAAWSQPAAPNLKQTIACVTWQGVEQVGGSAYTVSWGLRRVAGDVMPGEDPVAIMLLSKSGLIFAPGSFDTSLAPRYGGIIASLASAGANQKRVTLTYNDPPSSGGAPVVLGQVTIHWDENC